MKLIGKLQDGTVFFKKGYSDGDEGELFEFKTDEGNFNFPMCHPLTIICFYIN